MILKFIIIIIFIFIIHHMSSTQCSVHCVSDIYNTSTCLAVDLYVCVSSWLPLPVCLYICLSVCLSVYLCQQCGVYASFKWISAILWNPKCTSWNSWFLSWNSKWNENCLFLFCGCFLKHWDHQSAKMCFIGVSIHEIID